MVGLYIYASSHTVGQTLGLLKDFLQHEVRIAALLYLSQVDVDSLHLQFLLLTEEADYM